MATVMGATVAVSTNSVLIVGQRFTVTLTLTESGGTATNLVSIQPMMLTPSGVVAQGVRFGQPVNAAIMGNYTGAGVQIGANSSVIVNFDGVVDNPGVFHAPCEPNANYALTAVCQTSDGSVFSAPQQIIGFSLPQSGASALSPAPNGANAQSVILGTTTPQYGNFVAPGSLRFDYSQNTQAFPLLF